MHGPSRGRRQSTATATAAVALAAGLLLGVLPARVHAQVATARQGLSFGALIPGVTERVGLDDAVRRAEIMITWPGNAGEYVTLRFITPRTMVQPGSGAALPVAFAGADAATYDPTTGALSPFDPETGIRVRIKREGLTVYLAGAAQPRPAQRVGPYSATAILFLASTAQ